MNWKEGDDLHVLLRQASVLEGVDRSMKQVLNKQVIDDIVALIPEEWIAATFTESAETVKMVSGYGMHIKFIDYQGLLFVP
ncbi:MAG: hypothetical protein Q7U10_12200 [Thermodesulfovibrionia bacterium]|nr:hypothetical protein [Thermodesulfovibrionia bacterium]